MKKKTKGKGVIVTLILLIMICVSCGTVGFLESKNINKDKNNNKNENYQITYRYYLDGEELEEPLEQVFTEVPNPEFEGSTTEIPNYKFERYSCTKDVTGEWDEEEWTFKPELTDNSTCRLYFIKTIHEVTFKANNGKLPSGELEEKITAELEKESKINIKPNDGYKFDKVECNNGTTAEYDEITNDLTVSNVKKDSICTISFKISDFVVDVKANNGTVTTESKSVNYGDNATFYVTPSENYKFDTVTCTNGQKAIYNEANQQVIINGITNNTTCTVNFKPKKFTVSLTVENGNVETSQKEVAEGGTATFTNIKPNAGYLLSGATLNCTPKNSSTVTSFQQGVATIANVTADLQCKITLKRDETTTNPTN